MTVGPTRLTPSTVGIGIPVLPYPEVREREGEGEGGGGGIIEKRRKKYTEILTIDGRDYKGFADEVDGCLQHCHLMMMMYRGGES